MKEVVLEIANEYESRDMYCDLVIDQINALVSIFRKYNNGNGSIKEYKKAQIIKENLIDLKNICKTMGGHFYNSPLNIEKYYLGSTENYKDSLELEGHSDLMKLFIDYFQKSQTEVGQK